MFIPIQIIQNWSSKPFRHNALALLFLAGVFVAPHYRSVDGEAGTHRGAQTWLKSPALVAVGTVTLRSQVRAVLGDSIFAVSGQRIFRDSAVLVINHTGRPFALPGVGAAVQMTGDVVRLTPELEMRYNLNLDRELLQKYRDRPVIVAQSLGLGN